MKKRRIVASDPYLIDQPLDQIRRLAIKLLDVRDYWILNEAELLPVEMKARLQQELFDGDGEPPRFAGKVTAAHVAELHGVTRRRVYRVIEMAWSRLEATGVCRKDWQALRRKHWLRQRPK